MKKIYLTLVVSILSILSTCLHAMQVFVKKPDGRIISLDVERDHLVVNLKQKVEKMEGIPEQSQFLFFGGNILEDGSTLAAYGIETNSIIELISPKRILSVAPGDAFNVKAGTVVSFDKLDLVPSTDYSVTSSLDFNFANTIKAKDISLSYIDRIYTFLTPPNPFTGEIKFGYIDYEIKYATKMFLKLLYNGGVSSPWLLDFDSRSDWQSNSVSVTVANKTLREITLGDCSFYEYNSEVTACGAYNWRGKTLIASGKYFDLPRGINCDSIISINLTINKPSDSSQNITACGSYNWGGKTLTASGKYTDSLKTVNGCDSIVSLNLTINQPGASSQSIAACSSYNWRGKILTASGKYTDSLKTVSGCDSLITLNLLIKNNSTSTTTATAVNGFTWNGTNYTQSGSYTFTTSNAKGCDSIATLNLTINYNSPTSIRSSFCGSLVSTLNTSISAISVKNATAYKFKVTNGSNEEVVERTSPSFSFSLLTAKKYATTYDVQVAAKVNGFWSGYSSPCSISTPDYPVSKVKATQCNTTIAALSSTIGLDAVNLAVGYRVQLTIGEITETIDKSTTSFKLTDFTNKPFYGTTYNIGIAPMFTDTVVGYGTTCTVTTPDYPVSKVKATQCNTTIAALSSTIGLDAVNLAVGYRVQLTIGEITETIDKSTTSFKLTDFTNKPFYGTTYNIGIAPMFTDTVVGYGTTCTVTTPTVIPSIQSAYCDNALSLITSTFKANTITGAQAYRFIVTDGIYSDSLESTSTSMALSRFSNINLKSYGTQYSVSVRYKLNNVWLPKGPSCSISTPAMPLGLTTTTCNAGTFTASTKLVANTVTNATKYKLLLTYNGQRIDSITTTSASVSGSSFKNTTGKVVGRNYGLQVAVEYKGVFTIYSGLCSLTYVSPLGLNRTRSSVKEEVVIQAYPNPFHNGIVFESNDQTSMTVKVFDMTGRNISNHMGSIDELNQTKIGNNFTPGVYHIQIENENFSQSIRMIKE